MTTADTLKLESPETSATETRGVFACSDLLAVSYGGGTNSTAMLCGFKERGIKPDLILFADTGGEMPHTYKHVELMQGKVREWWGMEIEIVTAKYQGVFEGLEKDCLRKKRLPDLAYAMKGCSMKFKVEPQERRAAEWMKERGTTTVRWSVGYDAGEGHRGINKKVKEIRAGLTCHYWYPLVEWEWWREECVAAICRHKIPQPGKSSCFFCPAMKRSEIINLKENHPDLLARALAIEDAAQATVTTKRGLGGENNLWRDWLAMDESQSKLMLDIEPHQIPCGCIDG